MRGAIKWGVVLAVLLMLDSCSIMRYVPQDQTLLNRSRIKVDVSEVVPDDLSGYLQQRPNTRFIGLWRFKLNAYNLSDNDSTRWRNRWLRKIGEPPVIYDAALTERSRELLQHAMCNKGYLKAVVDTVTHTHKRKTNVVYKVTANRPYVVGTYRISLPDTLAMHFVQYDSVNALLPGMRFDIEQLQAERERVTALLRRRGYFNFYKELMTFVADTTVGGHRVDVLLTVQPQYLNDSAKDMIFRRKMVDRINIYCYEDKGSIQPLDSVESNGYFIFYNHHKRTFRPRMLIDKTSIDPARRYNERDVERTYANLNKLAAVRYVDISFVEKAGDLLDSRIYVTPGKKHAYSVGLEGTNTAGDFGVGLNGDYANKNMFRGAEVFKIGVEGSYEMMGKLGSVHSAWSAGGHMSLNFPSVLFPATQQFRKRSGGSTDVAVRYNYQRRPQYKRHIANASMSYRWQRQRTGFVFDLVDISYIHLPWVDEVFRQQYMSPSSSIRYSYEDHFIMHAGLTVSYTNRRPNQQIGGFYNMIGSLRTAGNLLYGVSRAFRQTPDNDGGYKIFGIRYAQYCKLEGDFSYNIVPSQKFAQVFHVAFGVAVPYLNATVIPYEERFFSGGSGSMRGWSVRSLGPGTYKNKANHIDYMTQSGDVKLELNLEARFRLIWKLYGAAFMDIGNIWTIKDYKEQPGGQFKWNTFYKQLGCDYGLGLRLDFSYFVLRFDMGIKLYDPGYETRSERWRTDLTWRDDVAFHFNVGYPF